MAEAAIKTIRVRNSDGTYSDPVPIGADSSNITVLADGSTLSDVLGAVNVSQKGAIQAQLDTLLQRVTNLEEKITELEEQIAAQ